MFRELVPQEGEILVVKTVDKNRRALYSDANGFQYPESGSVEAPDWKPTFQCGGGLHGLPWCSGDVGMLFKGDDPDTLWCVMRVKVSPENYLFGEGDLRGKCKFHRAEDISFGTREEVVANVVKYAPKDVCVHFAMQTAGDDSTQTAGDKSTQMAGNRSTQTAGTGTVQATRWYDKEWKVVTRVITSAEANKWYYVENGVWRLCTKGEIKDAEKRVGDIRE